MIAEQPLRLWQIVQQPGCAGMFDDLSGGHEEDMRSLVRMGDRVQLGIHAAFCAPTRRPRSQFETRKLRCRALRVQVGCIDHHGLGLDVHNS